jgi:uncharacterized repeat protein (TIGR02543 family)
MKNKHLYTKVMQPLLIFCLLISLFTTNGMATTYYVATTGSNSNDGLSTSTPFATIPYALTKATTPGDIIYVRAGTYAYTSTISISKTGTSTARYSLLVYPGDDRPIIDFSAMAYSSSNRGVSLSGSYWYIKGMRIKGAGDNGMYTSGAYNTVEFCDFFENRDGGCQIGGGANNNRFINCDSYYNADYGTGITTNGGNADGFSPKLDVGTGNYFYGCRAWLNSDDGWDGYMRPSDNITTTLENCWTWKNGYLKDGVTTTSDMNGNGFKLGGSDTKDLRHNFIVKNCLSFYNKANGYDQNSNVGSITLLNCTAVSNGGKNFYLSSSVTLPTGSVFTVTNCTDLAPTSTSFRSGTILNTNKFGAATTEFVSVDTTGISGPRKADGSLPDLNFMHLQTSPKSALIDAGTDVGLPFNGTKPDLGCYETGNSTVNYTLTTDIASGSGNVSPSGATKLFSSNTISVSATPASGYAFDKWTNASGTSISTSNPYTISMANGDVTVRANFLTSIQYTITTSVTGNGTITPASGTKYDAGTIITLTATPSAGYRFVNWTLGTTVVGTSSTLSVTMDADKTITANFIAQYTLTTEVTGNGTISLASGTKYDAGTIISLTATPSTGYKFVNWTSGSTILGTTSSISMAMNADKTITANFILATDARTLSSNSSPNCLVYSNEEKIIVALNLDQQSQISIYLYNIQGSLIKAIAPNQYSGSVDITMDKPDVAGAYICKIVIGNTMFVKKIMIL